jgi:hypothetical protein
LAIPQYLLLRWSYTGFISYEDSSQTINNELDGIRKEPWRIPDNGKKVKLSLWQVVEAHRVVKRRGYHIF